MVTVPALINQRYRLMDEIGQGGMGIVYRAQDLILEREVAVKILSETTLGSEGRVRLLHEAQAAAKLNHPNVITVYDAGETEKTPFIVMELLDSVSLADLQPTDLGVILTIAIQICAALEHAHNHGIIHRDLKPENVLVSADGTAKLMDFGLARSVVSRLTTEGTIVGTVFYLSPEQALGKEVDTRTDLYALGVMLYELTTGQLPFTSDDPFAIITQHLYAPVVPPRAKNEDIPLALDSLIVRLMSKEPQDRLASAGEVRRSLEAIIRQPADMPIAEAKEISLLDRIVRGRIVARERELAEAGELWERSRRGERQLLLVSGEPGVGKSRFVREVVTRAEVSRGTALVGECFREGGAPYAPIAQMVRSALQNGAGKLDLPNSVLADLLTLAPDMTWQFPDVVPNPSIDAESEQARLFENVVTFCQLVSQQSPLLMLLEDAHWADSGSLALFHHLARRSRNLKLMLLATYREVELDETLPLQNMLVALNRERLGLRIKLDRLDPKGTEVMLAALFAEEITPEFLEGIYRETEGNPFFIEEVCRALVENGSLYFEDGIWHRPDMDELEIPQSVRVAIQSRVGRLLDMDQEVLSTAAILGREFDYLILREAIQVDEEDLIEALENAEDAELIEEVSAGEGIVFRFTHALIPATLYEGIRTLRRRRMHLRVAKVIERLRPENYEALAYHFTEAGEFETAYGFYNKAGERADKTYANAEAEFHYQAALDIAESEDDQARLLARLGRVRARLGRYEQAINNDLGAANLYAGLGDMDHVARLYTHAALAAWDSGDTPRSLELSREGLDAAASENPGHGFALLLAEVGRDSYFNGALEDADKYCQEALNLAEALSLPDVQAEALNTLALNPNLLIDESIGMFERALEISLAAGLDRQSERSLHNLANLWSEKIGGIRKAREYSLGAIELARKRGALSNELYSSSILAYTYLLVGEYEESKPLLKRMRELSEALPEETGAKHLLSWGDAWLYRLNGKLCNAIDLMEALQVVFREIGNLQGLPALNCLMADIYFETEEYDLADEVIREAIQVAEEGVDPNAIEDWATFSNLQARRGRVGESRVVLERVKEKGSIRGFLAYELIAISTAEAVLTVAENDWERAWIAYSKLDDLLLKMEMPWHRARNLYEWAQAHMKRGQADDMIKAKQLLEAARTIFAELGVDYYVKQVKNQLGRLQQSE